MADTTLIYSYPVNPGFGFTEPKFKIRHHLFILRKTQDTTCDVDRTGLVERGSPSFTLWSLLEGRSRHSDVKIIYKTFKTLTFTGGHNYLWMGLDVFMMKFKLIKRFLDFKYRTSFHKVKLINSKL